MLNNRKENEVKKLGGVITAVDSPKLQFGQFTKLQNWIPGKKTSIKKKRGVVKLGDAALINLQQNFTCGVCTPEPGAQEVEWIATSFGEGYGLNNEINVSHIETFPDGTDEIYMYCYDLTSAYDNPINGVVKMNMGNVVGANQRTSQLIPFVPAVDSGVNGTISTQVKGAKRHQYIWYTGVFGTNNMQVFNVDTNTAVVMQAIPTTMVTQPGGSGGTWPSGKLQGTSISANRFAATDNNFLYQTGQNASNACSIAKWDINSGIAVMWTDVLEVNFNLNLIGAIQVTDQFLYVEFSDAGAGTTRIAKLNKSDLTLVTTYDVGKTPAGDVWHAFHVVGDNLIFLCNHDTNSAWGLYVFNISTNGPTKVIDPSLPNNPSTSAAGGVFPNHNMFVNITPNGDYYLYFVEHATSNGTSLRKWKFRCF